MHAVHSSTLHAAAEMPSCGQSWTYTWLPYELDGGIACECPILCMQHRRQAAHLIDPFHQHIVAEILLAFIFIPKQDTK